jgi:hypothetical protein
MSHYHMICQNLDSHCTHEEEQGINYVLVLIYLDNLEVKSKPSQPQHVDCGRFNYRSVWLI